MQEQQWTFPEIDRSGWGAGPWDGEPDKVQWKDAATGLPCLAVRQTRAGHWCGYVGVAAGHPLHGIDYNSECPATLAEALQRRMERPVGEHPGMAVMLGALLGELKPNPEAVFEVHGGLTFSGACSHQEGNRGVCHVPAPGEPDNVWWFGFDCAHAWDLSPRYAAEYASLSTDQEYRTLDFVRSHCASLAAQLSAVA